jgi:energy-coupling factor transport system substrate-specific component
MAWSALYVPLAPVLGPVGIESLYGMYFGVAILALYVIRKPGVGILAALVAGFVETLLGSPFGLVNIIVASLIQSVASEAAFALFRYKNWGLLPVVLAGLLPAPFTFVRDYFVFGYSELPVGTLAGMLIVRCISGVALGGILHKVVGDLLAATGTLRNFAISTDKAAA